MSKIEIVAKRRTTALYHGVEARIALPASVRVASGGTNGTMNDNMNFYLGLADIVEAGIYYYAEHGGEKNVWKVFVNANHLFSGGRWDNETLPSDIAGKEVYYRLLNLGGGSCRFIVDIPGQSGGSFYDKTFTGVPHLGETTFVKQVFGFGESSDTMSSSHSRATFKNVAIRTNKTGSTKAWTTEGIFEKGKWVYGQGLLPDPQAERYNFWSKAPIDASLDRREGY